jgi:nucleotide-binding universal stress UspA family protein
MEKSHEKVARKGEKRVRAQLPEFRRVLVTTDLSDLSNRAIFYAYSMLRSGGVVRIVHVEEPFEFANPIHGHHVAAAERLEAERSRQFEHCRAQLRALIPPEAAGRGILTEVEVIGEDKPAPAICEAAERFKADLICMVSHGRSGFSKALLGSIAHAVMASSSIPMLILRSPTRK